MGALTREPQRPEESDKDFEKRDEAHWEEVAKAEQKLLDLRSAQKERLKGLRQ